MIQTRTRPHVHVLDECGRSHVGIADQLRISERAVPRILRDAPPTPADGGADPRGEAPKRGRPSKASGALVERVRQLLVDEAGLRATEVYRRAVARGSAGRRSARSEPVGLHPPAPTPDLVVRTDGRPGDDRQLDFDEVMVAFAGGRRGLPHLFAGGLQRSRPLPVERPPDQKAETVARAIPTCGEPAHGDQVGPVEDPVAFVKGDLFPACRFSDPAAPAAPRAAQRDQPRPAVPRDPRGPGQALGQRLRCARGRRPHRLSPRVPRRTPPAAGRSAAASPRQTLAQHRSVAQVSCMTSPDWPGLLALAVAPAGHVTTADAAALGFSPELLIHHVRAGRLERARRGIYRVVHLPAAEDEDLVVIWLWSQRRGVFSHRTALALHQLSDLLPAQVDLTLPAEHARRRLRVPVGVQLHHAGVADEDRVWVGHVPVTSVLRTLQDCAALPLAPDLLGQALREAEQRGLAGRAELDRITARGAR